MNLLLTRFDSALEHPVVAGAQRHDRRTSLFLRLECDGVDGVGEVSPQNQRLNGDPGLDDVIRELRAVVLPQVRRIYAREGRPPTAARMSSLRAPRSENATAIALVEMALLDRELRVEARTLADAWAPIHEVLYQRTVSLLDDEPWADLREVSRVRAKVAPRALNDAALERISRLDAPVILDFNASARTVADVRDVLERVGPLAKVVAVEQPFAVGDFATTSQLARTIDVGVSLDESIRSVSDLRHAVRYDAAELICVKPARVGGLATARTIVALAYSLGLRAYVGGFFETPYARFVHRALVRASTTEPSDVADITRIGPEFTVAETPFGVGIRPSDEVFHHVLDLSGA